MVATKHMTSECVFMWALALLIAVMSVGGVAMAQPGAAGTGGVVLTTQGRGVAGMASPWTTGGAGTAGQCSGGRCHGADQGWQVCVECASCDAIEYAAGVWVGCDICRG